MKGKDVGVSEAEARGRLRDTHGRSAAFGNMMAEIRDI